MNRFGQILTLSLVIAGLVAVATPVSAALPATQKQQMQRQPRDPDRFRRLIEKEVRHELVMLPYYSVFDNLEFRVVGARIELSGQVVRPSLRSDAEAVVKGIEGVEAVDNKIEVLPLSPNDDRIRRAVYRAIYSYDGLFRYSLQAVPPIHIIVKNGHVTLEGVVANETDKNLANLQANTVPGAFSVTNHLRTEK